MNFEHLHKIRVLVDDLCLLHSGWQTPEEHQDYLAALNRVAGHGNAIKRRNEVKRLQAKIEELEAKQ
jgi:hypothetical protein